MNSSQIFKEMPPALSHTILHYLRDEQREAYKATINALAQKRKLRPVYIQRKPKEAQLEWIGQTLTLKGSAEIGDQILSLFLMQGRQDMLKHFLDAMGIEHDGDGTVEDLPESLDATKLQPTVDSLLTTFPEQEGVLYLKIFQQQTPEGWPELQAIIDSDPRFTHTSTEATG
ncbi:MAG: hypothetical protein ACI9TH_002440 [Kiritimatiellia bacterium]|jgi:hypothetical protein